MAETATKTTSAEASNTYKGTEKLLWGIVLAVLTYWLFAGTLGNLVAVVVADIGTEYITESVVSLAAPLAGLFSGLFIVVMGGVADKVGRVKVTLWGLVIGFIGALMIAFAMGTPASALLLIGRALQGFSAACIMPSTMALLKAYWDGKERQRAVSMWSIGSWGGSGLAALFGGFLSQQLNWRWIFIICAIVCVLAFLMIVGTPESKVEQKGPKKPFDVVGLLSFMVSLLCFMVALMFGAKMPNGGWLSPITLVLFVIAIVGLIFFVRWELKNDNPFIDFGLFKNTTFTGATISNFMINATIGLLNISQLVLQGARPRTIDDCGSDLCRQNFIDANGDGIHDQYMSAWDAGLLTIGYAVTIILFIRLGERLLQRFGPRKPMIWGSLIVLVSGLCLTPTFVTLGQYKVLAAIGYALFGLGLAFYATPSTDAALSNLPADKSGAGSGIYKMASSLGGAIGLALSLAIFNALKGGDQTVGYALQMTGVQDNVSLRFAGMVVMLFNIVLTLIAILSIVMTVPKGGGSKDLGKSAASADPKPHLTMDEEKQAILDRLSNLSTTELEELERLTLVKELEGLDRDVLEEIVEEHKS